MQIAGERQRRSLNLSYVSLYHQWSHDICLAESPEGLVSQRLAHNLGRSQCYGWHTVTTVSLRVTFWDSWANGYLMPMGRTHLYAQIDRGCMQKNRLD